MKKISEKQRAWLKSRSKKVLRYASKRKLAKSKRNCDSVAAYVTKASNRLGHRLHAPVTLSLLENRDETLRFFEYVLKVIGKCSMADSLYFDLSDVEYISADAIMYIVAVIGNARRVMAFRIKCAGNLPQNAAARKLIEKSGFYKFVSKLNTTVVSTTNELVQISSGNEADGAIAAKICDFVHSVSTTGTKDTKGLFSVIMELMTNTKQHAYRSKSSVMISKWYVFAKDSVENIEFIFLDTGAGIPATINKRLLEKANDFMRGRVLGYNDSEYIASALRGELRTETKQEYRGKGLPGIYDDSCQGTVSDLTIISGFGECRVEQDCSIGKHKLETKFSGTLFSWKLNKEIPHNSWLNP